MSNDFLGTASFSLEVVRSLDRRDGETDFLIIGLLDLSPDMRVGDGLFEPNADPKDALVIENLDGVGDATGDFSSSTLSMIGGCDVGDFIGDGKSSSVSVTLLKRRSTFLSDFKGSKYLCGEYRDL